MTQTEHSFLYEGDDRGVLLIHGLTGTPNEMRIVGKGLNKAGFTVYGLQLAGHCGSEKDLTRTGWRDWYGSVVAGHEFLRARSRRVFVAGLSAGALLALHLAAQRPHELDGLALYSTTLFYDGWNVPWGQFLLPWVLRLPFGTKFRFAEREPFGIKDERLRARVKAGMLSGDSSEAGLPTIPGKSIRQLHRLMRVVRREIPRVFVPTLIQHAREDDLASLKNAQYVADRLAGPKQLVVLDDCYHMITVDKQRMEVIRNSVEFFSSVTAQWRPPEVVDPSSHIALA